MSSKGKLYVKHLAQAKYVIKGKKLQSFNTYNSVVSNITNIIVPVTLGSIIDSSSLFVVSTFLIVVGVLQVISTLFMKSETKENVN